MEYVIASILGVFILAAILITLFLRRDKPKENVPEFLDFETDSDGHIIQGTISDPEFDRLMDEKLAERALDAGSASYIQPTVVKPKWNRDERGRFAKKESEDG